MKGRLARPFTASMFLFLMERPTRFEEHRWVGDKRTQVAHDIDSCDAPDVIAELVASERFLCFAPDDLAEARNRGYRRCRTCPGARRSAEAELGGE